MTEEQMESPRLTPEAAAWGQISSAAPATATPISRRPVSKDDLRTVLTNIISTSLSLNLTARRTAFFIHMPVPPHY